MITAQQVANYLGRGDDAAVVALAGVHLPHIQEMVKAYTRGVGFYLGDPEPALEAVIISATARLTQNPELSVMETAGSVSARRSTFEGFNLVERLVLDGYRRKAS